VLDEDLGSLDFTYGQSSEAPVSAGLHQVTGTFAGTSNYEAASGGATLTILKARPTVVVDDASVTYDGQPHGATGRVAGVRGEDLGALSFTYDQSSDEPVNARLYRVTGSFAGLLPPKS